MSEIKSTLDLVMEKTRHLTLSQEEKQAQKRIEVKNRLKGILQKYQDSLLRKESLVKELNSMKVTYDLNVDEMLAELLLDRLKLGRNNTLFLELLSEICGLNVKALEVIFQQFKEAVKSATEQRVEQIKSDLAKRRFISGSAVVPNLETDKEWLSMLGHIKGSFDQALNKEKAALIPKLSLD